MNSTEVFTMYTITILRYGKLIGVGHHKRVLGRGGEGIALVL